jgi:anti-sigma factor RsiW
MTDCPNAEMRDRLPLLEAGRLDPAARAAVEAHVAACADCAAELALLRRVRAVTARTPVVDAGRIAAAVRDAARLAPRRRTQLAARPAWSRWRVPAAAAAALLAALVWESRSNVDGDAPVPTVVGAAGSGSDSGAAIEIGSALASGLTFGGGLADLTEMELEALATSIAEIDPLPAAEPPSIAPDIPFELEGTI